MQDAIHRTDTLVGDNKVKVAVAVQVAKGNATSRWAVFERLRHAESSSAVILVDRDRLQFLAPPPRIGLVGRLD